MWYYRKIWLWVNERNLPFKMEIWSTDLQAEAAVEASDQLSAVASQFSHASTRYKIKEKKDFVLSHYTDLFGERKKLNHPIFTQNEIAKIEQNQWMSKIMGFFFILLEGVIFSQLIGFMIERSVREEYPWMPLLVGVILSYLMLLVVMKALEAHFTYLEARLIQRERNFEEYKLSLFKRGNQIAISFFILFIGFCIFAGIVREKMLLGETAEANPFLGRVVFFMSLILSLMVILVLAYISRNQAENSIKYAIFKNWKKHEKERKEYINILKNLHESDAAGKVIDNKISKFWQLMNEIKKVFDIDYDTVHKDLYIEFRTENPNHNPSDGISVSQNRKMNESFYQKYKFIQSADADLFKFGVLRNSYLVELQNNLKEKIKAQYDEIIKFENNYKNENAK